MDRVRRLIPVAAVLAIVCTFAVTPAGKNKRPAAAIAVLEVVPFSDETTSTPGSPLTDAYTQDRVSLKCGLGSRLSELVASGAGSRGVAVERVSDLESFEGRVLWLEIDGVQGRLGGAVTGTKSLTVRGELRDGETVVASFTARRQQTALASGTCKAFNNCAKSIAKDIAKWLKKPVMRARLGTA